MGSIEVRKLESFNLEDLKRLVSGYISTHKYTVEKIEKADGVTLILRLVALDKPYVKVFPPPAGEILDRYSRVVGEGLSLGAYDADQLVGLAIAQRRDWNRSLWLWELGIEETRRRTGIGTKLIESLVHLAKDSGLRVIVCETQNTNVPAIDFYRKTGFELDGIDLSYYTNTDMTTGEVALFMKRKLDRNS